MLRNPAALEEREFDVLICGGGIYGAWCAYDAALRGLKVAIVEQGDWASATSSASSKLIHGGLRYLETLDFGLVRKALLERNMLLKAAPHRIWPLRFAIPIYRDSRLGGVRLSLGLRLYDFLAGVSEGIEPHRRFSAAEFNKRFPFLKADTLAGGFDYGDAQTDDARLILELIDGAVSAGAVCLNYCRVTDYLDNHRRVCGVTVEDVLTNNSLTVRAKQIVNAGGQWLVSDPKQQTWCRLSKGVHLLLPKLLEDEALLLTAKADGRVFFMMPWYGLTLLGTTDTDYSGDVEKVHVEDEDIDYLLSEANQVLGTISWTKKDIIGQFAGLRVLKSADDKAVSNVSRDWELKTLDNGLLVSIGGKITSARKDAACIVDKVCENLGVAARSKTEGRNFPWTPEQYYPDWLAANIAEAEKRGIDPESVAWLLRRHGSRISVIFRLVDEDRELAQRIVESVPLILADLIFCAQHEMVMTLEDLLRRRLPLLITCRLKREQLSCLAEKVSRTLGWDEAELDHQIKQCEDKWLQQ